MKPFVTASEWLIKLSAGEQGEWNGVIKLDD